MHDVQLPALRPTSYAAPTTIAEALAMLADGGRVVAGGTDLMIEMDRRICNEVKQLIDITRIAGLDKISVVDGRVHLGPLVTHNQCTNSPIVVEHGLALGAGLSGSGRSCIAKPCNGGRKRGNRQSRKRHHQRIKGPGGGHNAHISNGQKKTAEPHCRSGRFLRGCARDGPRTA